MNQLLQRLDTLKNEKDKIIKKHEGLMTKIAEGQDAGVDQRKIDKSMAEAQRMLDKVKELDREVEESKAQTDGFKEWKTSSKKQLQEALASLARLKTIKKGYEE